MKKLFDFLVWHFGLPMIVGWSLLLLFGFADNESISQCQDSCIADCADVREYISTNLDQITRTIWAINDASYEMVEDYEVFNFLSKLGNSWTNDVLSSADILALNIENVFACGQDDQYRYLYYPSSCSIVCSSNNAASCSLHCITNRYDKDWYCSLITNYFYGGAGYNEVIQEMQKWKKSLDVKLDSHYVTFTNIFYKSDKVAKKAEILQQAVDSLPCDDYCTRCSSNCVQKLGTNCVIECRIIDEDGIYREECSTNCWEGPLSPCCDFGWLEDMLDDLMDDINSMLEDFDTLIDWLDNWKTFLGWVDYYSRRPPGMEWVRKYKFSPIHSYTVDGDLVITNQLRSFDYKEVNESFGTLSGNYFYDSVQMAYEIFSEVNQANAILASLNTNLSMRLEEKEMDVESATNRLETAFDGQVGDSTNQFASALGSFTNVFEFGDYKSPKIQGVEQTSVMPSTFTLTLPFDFHEQDLGGDIERRDFSIPVDDPAFVKFVSLVRCFFILFYWFVIVVFWLFVGRYMFKLVLKVFDLVCTYLPRWV